MASALASDRCLWYCGEHLLGANTGVGFAAGTLSGRVAPKTAVDDEGVPTAFTNFNHMNLDSETLTHFIARENADKVALLRLDNCGAEYRWIAEITQKGDANPFKTFKSTADASKTNTLDTTREYAEAELQRSTETAALAQRTGKPDRAVKTPDDELKKYPYNAVGLLWLDDTSCTMTLIGPKHGVTAAHCVFNTATSNWRDVATLKFFPGSSNHWGWKSSTSDRNLAGAACEGGQDLCYLLRSVTIPARFVRALELGHSGEYHDWAIVELQRATNHGHMAFGEYVAPTPDTASTWTAASAGYPRGLVNFWQYKLPYPIYKKTDQPAIDSVTKYKVIGNPTDKYYVGQSGSSIWRASDKVIEAIFFGLLTTDDIAKNEADTAKPFEAAGIVDKKKYRIWCSLLGGSGATLCK